jgi:hypothetical protein
MEGETMKKIFARSAIDMFRAERVAQGMQNTGADVFSITSSGQSLNYGASEPKIEFQVWARADDWKTEKIDREIEKELNRIGK